MDNDSSLLGRQIPQIYVIDDEISPMVYGCGLTTQAIISRGTHEHDLQSAKNSGYE